MSLVLWALTAFAAADCEKVAIEGAEMSLDGVRSLAVRDVRGAVEIVGGDRAELTASGTSCTAGGAIRLVKRDGVATLVVKGPGEVALVLVVPRTLAAVGVYGQIGALTVRDLPARVSVTGATGAVDVRDASSVRVADSAGAVSVEDVPGAVYFDRVVGAVTVRGIGGEVASSDVTGGVQVL